MSIYEQARENIIQHVPIATREAAAGAIAFFADRPSASAIDFDLQAVKLAGLLHEIGAEQDDVLAAILELEKSTKFRPTNAEIIQAVEKAMQMTTVFVGYDERGAIVGMNISARRLESMEPKELRDLVDGKRLELGLSLAYHGYLPPREVSKEMREETRAYLSKVGFQFPRDLS